MWQLFQFPLCPFSRKVRLVLGEKGVAHELVRENPWERRDEFIDLNPAGETPVLVDSGAGTTLIDERMRKRLVSRESPDTRVLREAMRIANGHLDYLDYLLDHRRWIAGAGLSLADFTAAAHLSVIDYLGALDWRGHKQTKDWYAVMKSRPAFRPLLGERMEVIVPPAHYDKVDF